MISLAFYLIVFVVGSIFHLRYPVWLQNVLLLLIVFSIGISGLIILNRGEFIGKNGQIMHGWQAYILGILFILFGFGATVSGLYNIFFR